MSNTKLFVLTGPESSGKTSLATQLCDSLQAPLVPEASREYLREIKTAYQKHDLLAIAKLQHGLETTLSSRCDDIIICDTDLLVMIIWSEVKYGSCDPWISQTFADSISNYPPRHYFLCDYHIPWQSDPLRENPGDREQLFSLYLQKCQQYQLSYSLVEGTPQQRLRSALQRCRQ